MNETNSLPEEKKPFVFSLRLVFYVISLLASGMAISPETIVTTFFILLFWGCCLRAIRSKNRTANLFGVAIGFILFMCCFGMLLPATSSVGEAARRSMCRNNLRQLGLGMLNFETAYGRFPKANKIAGGNSHSWRVAILPFIEFGNVYKAYDYGQAWDSPSNKKLAEIRIDCMSCPSVDGSKTTYKLVTGPGTLFEKGKSGSMNQMADGTSHTILMVEDNSAPVFWSDPKGDLSVDQAVDLLSNLDVKNAIHCWEGLFEKTYPGTHVLVGNGETCMVGYNADPDELRRAFLCADGQPVKTDITELGERIKVVKYGAIVAAVFYCVLAVVPVFPLFKEFRQHQRKAASKPQNENENENENEHEQGASTPFDE